MAKSGMPTPAVLVPPDRIGGKNAFVRQHKGRLASMSRIKKRATLPQKIARIA